MNQNGFATRQKLAAHPEGTGKRSRQQPIHARVRHAA